MASSVTGIVLVGEGFPKDSSILSLRAYYQAKLSNRHFAHSDGALWSVRSRSLAKKYAQRMKPAFDHVLNNTASMYASAPDSVARELQNRLCDQGKDARALFAESFGTRSIQSAFSTLRAQGCERVIVLSLFPQEARHTTTVIREIVHKALSALRWKVPLTVIGDYYDNEKYVSAVAASIAHAGYCEEQGDKLVFSYRAIPLADVEKGDEYELETGATSLSVAGAMGLSRQSWTIAYQDALPDDRVWLSPTTLQVVRRTAATSTNRLFIVCPGYSFEGPETLFGAQMVLRKEFLRVRKKAQGACCDEDYVYVPALGKTKAHVKVLQGILEEKWED